MILVNRSLYRGPRPKDLCWLKKVGVKHIVSLQSGFYQLTHDDSFEKQFPADFGIFSWDLGCSNILPPEDWEVMKFLEIVLRAIENYETVFVHCKTGVDRTGYMIAAYKMLVSKEPFDMAHLEWVVMGRHWWFDWWKYKMKGLSERLGERADALVESI